YLVNQIIRPAASEGKVVVVLAEEWHTASTVINLHNYLQGVGLRNQTVIFWNANNTYGFWNIDWWALKEACTITTVSRYMKHLMWKQQVNPMVIPNGIPRRLLSPLDPGIIEDIQSIFEEQFYLVKVGRYTPDKRWIMAIDAVAHLKHTGHNVTMLMRGGMEPHRADVYFRAQQLGLDIREIKIKDTSYENITRTLRENNDADLIEMNFFIPEEFLRYMYGSADAVMANSGHEPFGLVGLEVMATGGIPFVGASGEDYATAFQNSIVVETNDPREISSYLLYLADHRDMLDEIRLKAKQTARDYTWEEVLEDLLGKIEFIARVYGEMKV
ncbi:MAG: glycosyltransferase family 4 protein, partial [Vulcanimicrobiota bacterium]